MTDFEREQERFRERAEAGMMAVSRAGHDKDTLYLILRVEGSFAWLADGKKKPKEAPKKKRLKHLQVIRKKRIRPEGFSETDITNEEIKSWIKRESLGGKYVESRCN